jgi:iron(II)-dependent oxidoreductase
MQTLLLLGQAAPSELFEAQPPEEEEKAVEIDLIAFDAQEWRLGSDGTGAEEFILLDSDYGKQVVTVSAFEISKYPITNAQYIEFINAGGYQNDALWSYEGRRWKKASQMLPKYWKKAGNGFLKKNFNGEWMAVSPNEPVCFLTFYEAEAFCSWKGGRLPTEAEWEIFVASLEQKIESNSINFQSKGLRSVTQVKGGVGNVWEWTKSSFFTLPGFVCLFPYREQSAPWQGYRKVVKGASWMTGPLIARPSYRNFHLPIQDEVCIGFRLVMEKK